jgi:hypothetical protein
MLDTFIKGNEHTFVIRNSEDFIDLTQGTDKIWGLVTNCHVSDEISLSDHRYTVFQILVSAQCEQFLISEVKTKVFPVCTLILNCGTRWRWDVNCMYWLLYPWYWLNSGWVGTRAGLCVYHFHKSGTQWALILFDALCISQKRWN